MAFSILPKGAPDILYVMAAEPEYGPALRTRITPLMIGVGPVEATLSTSLARWQSLKPQTGCQRSW
jgi:adenosylhomocysteine nucleosidase